MAECTWGKEAVVYIDALLVCPKIVVRFREKVGDFQLFVVRIQINNWFSGFLRLGKLSLPMSDEPDFSALKNF